MKRIHKALLSLLFLAWTGVASAAILGEQIEVILRTADGRTINALIGQDDLNTLKNGQQLELLMSNDGNLSSSPQDSGEVDFQPPHDTSTIY